MLPFTRSPSLLLSRSLLLLLLLLLFAWSQLKRPHIKCHHYHHHHNHRNDDQQARTSRKKELRREKQNKREIYSNRFAYDSLFVFSPTDLIIFRWMSCDGVKTSQSLIMRMGISKVTKSNKKSVLETGVRTSYYIVARCNVLLLLLCVQQMRTK